MACLPRTDSNLAPRGLHGTGAMIVCIRPEPMDAKIECAIFHRRVACLQRIERAKIAGRERETELQSEYSRSQDGIEILMEGDAAIFDLA